MTPSPPQTPVLQADYWHARNLRSHTLYWDQLRSGEFETKDLGEILALLTDRDQYSAHVVTALGTFAITVERLPDDALEKEI